MAYKWLSDRASYNNKSPWMLNVGFPAPHFPLVVPSKYLNLYPLTDIPPLKIYKNASA